jgi:glycosyltransferase involved in cell wall biosynthesis
MHRIIYDDQTFALQQYGGISRYFCEVALRVAHQGTFDVHVVAPFHYNDYLAQSGVPTVGVHLAPRIPRTGRLYRAANAVLAPLVTRLAKPALVHQTYYKPSRAPDSSCKILTVFDMIHELFPEGFPASDSTAADKRASVAQADHIICISQNTRSDLIRLLDVDPAKVSVTYLGCSGLFEATADPSPQPGEPERPYILYVGHRAGYKNFANALRAYASSARLVQEFDFLAFGGFAFSVQERELFRSLGLRDGSVRRLTGDDAQLARAYRRARVLVYPSLYEGFGIPPLEAMSCGCPVAGSSTSSIPEVIGPAGELFDPHSVDSIAAALERVCLDEQRRARLITEGTARLERFSWDRCATETMGVYCSALGLAAQ